MVVNNTSTVMCLKEVHLYSISTIKSIELSVKPKMLLHFVMGCWRASMRVEIHN